MTARPTETVLRSEEPERWSGPSLAVCLFNETEINWFLSGFFYRLADWEGIAEHSKNLDLSCDIGQTMSNQLDKAKAVFVKVDLDCQSKETAKQLSYNIISKFDQKLPKDSFLNKLPDFQNVSSTANKLPDLQYLGLDQNKYQLLDLTAMTLPNRHGNKDLPFTFCRRRCRLLLGENWSLALWEPPDQNDCYNWKKSTQRWPHHGIPTFNYAIKSSREPKDCSVHAMTIESILINERYFLRHLMSEIEMTESDFFQKMNHSNDYPTSDLKHLVETTESVARLENYLYKSRETAVRIRRRIDNSKLSGVLKEKIPECAPLIAGETFGKALDKLDESITKQRKNLANSLKVISTSAEIVKIRNNLESKRKLDKYRLRASWFAAIFSIVSLGLAIFGPNISDLDPVRKGSIIVLGIIAMVCLAVIFSATSIQLKLRGRREKKLRDSKENSNQNN